MGEQRCTTEAERRSAQVACNDLTSMRSVHAADVLAHAAPSQLGPVVLHDD